MTKRQIDTTMRVPLHFHSRPTRNVAAWRKEGFMPVERIVVEVPSNLMPELALIEIFHDRGDTGLVVELRADNLTDDLQVGADMAKHQMPPPARVVTRAAGAKALTEWQARVRRRDLHSVVGGLAS